MRDKFKHKSFDSISKYFGLILFLATMTYSCSSGPQTSDANTTSSSAAQNPLTLAVESKVASVDSDLTFSVSASKALDGSILLVKITGGDLKNVKDMKVVFEGVDFPVYSEENPAALGALVVVPFNSKPRSSKIEFSWSQGSAKKNQTAPIEIVDGNYRSEVLTVDDAHANPSKKALKRILAEQKEIGQLYWASDKTRHWNGPFVWPIKSELTSPFGNKRLFNGQMKSFHQGLDLRAPVGTPIVAGGTARVAMAKDLFFTGNTVILDHGLGLFTIYAHMSKLNVKKGQMVKQGDLLGLSGMTGRASGPHLHWGAVLQRLKFNPENLIQVLR